MTVLILLCALFLVPAAIIECAEIACVLAAAAWEWVAGKWSQSQSYGK